MKIIILLSVLFYSVNTYSQNYITKYHSRCNKAASFYLKENFTRALRLINRGFKNRIPFPEDLQLKALCYYKLNNRIEGRKYLLKAMDSGAHPFMLDRVRPVLESLGFSDECDILRDSVLIKFERFCYQNEGDKAWIIQNLSKIDEKYQNAIAFYENNFNTVNESSDSAISYHKNVIEPIFVENKEALAQIIDSIGIPNLRYPQIQSSFILAMVHSSVDAYDVWKGILFNSLKNGELLPDQYVFAIEIFQARSSTNSSEKITYLISSCESGEIDNKILRNRKKVGLGNNDVMKLRSFTF